MAVSAALEQAGIGRAEVEHFLFTTDTGISTPNIEALVINRLRMNVRIRRTPLFGLGCAGGAGGIARASNYLASCPDQIAVLLSVELCSLTFQRNDLSVANLTAATLFGDGAAAVVIGGAARARPGGAIEVTFTGAYGTLSANEGATGGVRSTWALEQARSGGSPMVLLRRSGTARRY